MGGPYVTFTEPPPPPPKQFTVDTWEDLNLQLILGWGPPENCNLHFGRSPPKTMVSGVGIMKHDRDSLDPEDEPSAKRHVTVNSEAEEIEYEPSSPGSPVHQSADEPMSDHTDRTDAEASDSQNADDLDQDGNPAEQSQESHLPSAEEATRNLELAQNSPIPIDDDDDELIAEEVTHYKPSRVPKHEEILEVSLNITPDDITDNHLFLWNILEECFLVAETKAKQRRVEVNYRKLSPEDKKLFDKAMQKEWQS